MCLRGSDPFLRRTLEALAAQSHQPSAIRLIVDHASDPAVSDVRIGLAASLQEGRANLSFLEDPLVGCSLKCSSLVQACRDLPAEVDVVAFLDADTLPDAEWLARLCRPFADESVAVVTGNRWFDPPRSSFGAVARQVWNAAAIVQMSEYRIPWGGTLCVRRSFLEEAKLPEKWGKAFCEDTMLRREAGRLRKKVVFEPTLLIPNGEDCTPGDFLGWCSRQLLTARLYHPAWTLVSGHAILAAGLPVAAILAALVYAVLGEWRLAGGYALVLALLVLGNAALVERIYRLVASLFHRMGRPLRERSLAEALFQGCVTGISPFLYLIAYLRSLFVRRVRWRGIDYDIHGPWDVRMLGYRPYAPRSPGDEMSL
ncbi:MAG TPA: glycosyltransferase family 2 protein [Pirellulaceae bacterium]|nr:glycosyltransferase family 2 protein [Pirellulaceae bacterium]